MYLLRNSKRRRDPFLFPSTLLHSGPRARSHLSSGELSTTNTDVARQKWAELFCVHRTRSVSTPPLTSRYPNATRHREKQVFCATPRNGRHARPEKDLTAQGKPPGAKRNFESARTARLENQLDHVPGDQSDVSIQSLCKKGVSMHTGSKWSHCRRNRSRGREVTGEECPQHPHFTEGETESGLRGQSRPGSHLPSKQGAQDSARCTRR